MGYSETGPQEGAPVLLLHGYPSDIHSYVDVIPLLAARGLSVIVTLGGVVSMPPPLLHAGAPDGFTGAVASLLIVTGADVAQLPAVSVATAWISYAPVASDPVVHQSSTVQLVALHVFCSTTPPLP